VKSVHDCEHDSLRQDLDVRPEHKRKTARKTDSCNELPASHAVSGNQTPFAGGFFFEVSDLLENIVPFLLAINISSKVGAEVVAHSEGSSLLVC
jgi:hypothetical protein